MFSINTTGIESSVLIFTTEITFFVTAEKVTKNGKCSVPIQYSRYRFKCEWFPNLTLTHVLVHVNAFLYSYKFLRSSTELATMGRK